MTDLLTQVQQYSREKVGTDTSGHDYFHAKRVAKTAQELAHDTTEIDMELMLTAAYLHDVIDDKVATDPVAARKDLVEFLKSLGWSPMRQVAFFAIIEQLSFSNELEFGKAHLSLEGQLVQDADRLDALGAIGILRTAYYGGHTDSPLYDPQQPPQTFETKAAYRKKGPVLNHFYEKLFKLPASMNTATGKKEADRRVRFMQDFLLEFYSECGEDFNFPA